MGACCDSRAENVTQKPGDIKKMKSSTAPMSAVDDAKERARVEEIWRQYDTNNSGVLERD